jgi:dienelactone hydrolase
MRKNVPACWSATRDPASPTTPRRSRRGSPARPQDAINIKAKILVCIGADDPIIPPEQRADFEKEMKAAGTVDWRLQLYGGTGHSFTNPASDARGMKGFFYHEATDRRSWNAMIELFNEVFGETK